MMALKVTEDLPGNSMQSNPFLQNRLRTGWSGRAWSREKQVLWLINI